MTQQQKVLHTLDRFTFGPRPGDEAVVTRMGLNTWFEQQLHPATIPDVGLDARLAAFPAMQLSQTELIERFPTPGMLRQYTRGGIDAPADPVEQAIYADAGLSYKEKLEAKATARSDTATAVAGAPAMGATLGAPATLLTPAAQTTAQGKRGDLPAPMDADAAQAIVALPPAARMARLVALSPEDMQALREALKGKGQQRLYEGFSPAEIEQVAAMQGPLKVVGEEAMSTRLLRDVYSERQLQAVMTDFWLNHFNVYLRKNQNEPYLLPAFEREAILPHALGRFEDLLVATAESPAMLVYLDNWTSIGPDSRAAGRAGRGGVSQNEQPLKVSAKRPIGINENYARELMELHTLGVNGGYTQGDVIEVAKCFTGWTITRPEDGGEFTFNPKRHEPGAKTVLGHVIPEGGENEGLEVLHLLASSPVTAHFISLELAERFVSDTPPPALVNRMTSAYLHSDGDIAAVLSAMFHAPEFWSQAMYRAKVKTPLEFMASALRASNAQITNPLPLVQAMNRLGMPLYGMQTPNGYSWQSDAWVSSSALLTRMNFALLLSGNRLPGTRLNWVALLGVDPGAVPDAATEVKAENEILGQPAAAQTREAVLAEANNPTAQHGAEQSFRSASISAQGKGQTTAPGDGLLPVSAPRRIPAAAPESPLATAAGLLLGSPDFQRR